MEYSISPIPQCSNTPTLHYSSVSLLSDFIQTAGCLMGFHDRNVSRRDFIKKAAKTGAGIVLVPQEPGGRGEGGHRGRGV